MNGTPTRVLIVDDDPEIRSLLARYLSEQGFKTISAADRREYNDIMKDSQPDIIVLDVMLPDGSGLDICRELRGKRSQIPVILLTALKEDVDRIIGLEIGADDYLGKPFNPRELVARIRAVLRRAKPDYQTEDLGNTTYRLPDHMIYPEQRTVIRTDGEKIELTGAEFDLLMIFIERPGRLLSRDLLLDISRGRDRDPMDRSIDILVSRLRRKLYSDNREDLFKTVRNGGYQLAVSVKKEVLTNENPT